MSIETITQDLQNRLSEFAGLNARIRFDMGTDGAIAIDAKDGTPGMADDDMEADCTIRISAENMEKLMTGALNPMLAYTLGKLKIDGSMGVAMKVAALLEE
ncbi:MAG: SCP2 sterol-binding domain-containing protein [Alphaproteobacteria bacterium]